VTTRDDTHMLNREQLVAATGRPLPPMVRTVSLVLIIAGAITFVAGAVGRGGQDRVWQALLANWLFFSALSQAGVVFVAVQRITTARWSRPVVRLLEGYVAFLPVSLILLAVLLIGGVHLFPGFAQHIEVAEKRFYLQPGFMAARDLFVVGLLTSLSCWYIYRSLRLDVGLLPESGASWARGLRERMRAGFGEERREIHRTHSMQGRLAVILCLLFGMGYTVVAWDLSMTLDPHFQSTLYSWWFFMGGWLCALTSWSLLTMAWRRYLNAYDLITETHIWDLGKLCFAFTAFWGYLTFGQYLVIWYGNMGEETHFMHLRLSPPWVGTTLTIVFLVFVIPFFGLLSRAAKVYLPTFILFASSSLIGMWLLRYIEVYPSLNPTADTMPLGVWELGVTLGVLGLWGFCYSSFMDAFPRVRVALLTSPFRDEVQVPVNPDTMEPLPAHE